MRSTPALAVLSLLPTLALAAPAPPSPQLEALREQVVALQVDRALGLSRQQAQALLPILQNARAQVQAFEAQRAAAEPAIKSALTQAVADLEANGVVSSSTVRAVNAARPSSQALRASLRSSWTEVQKVISPAQLAAVRETPMGISRDEGARAEPGAPGAGGPGNHGRHGRGKHGMFMHVALSDAFLALVQARAG